MTSDYISEILGLQGWAERALNEDSYFASGEAEDVSESMQVPHHTEKVSNTVCFCETGCQTPSEWLTAGPAQEANEGVRRAAVKRERPSIQGTNPPCPGHSAGSL